MLKESFLEACGGPSPIALACSAQILATKKHEWSSAADTNYFTDADLSILGSSASAYTTYCQQIRQEYSKFPDLLYRPGRRKVLKQFLEMSFIFKTEHFRNLHETQARFNIRVELASL